MLLSLLIMNTGKDRRILIVDAGQARLKNKLDGLGYTASALEKVYDSDKTSERHLIDSAKGFQPDLMIGDFFGNQCDHWIHTFRSEPMLSQVPIILCSDKENICSVIRKINGNVNDYMVLPVIQEEIKARIERVMTLHESLLNTNPLSHLPGNIAIKREITRRSNSRDSFAVIYLDLDNFKAFNDYYGYSKGDEVIQYVAELLKFEALIVDKTEPHNFIGHIGGDDFVGIRRTEDIVNFCRHLLHSFDQKIPGFYSRADRKQGYIMSIDRKGQLRKFPLMTLSAAVVINHEGESMHYGEISSRGSEIKHHLKSLDGSNCLVDRRRGGIKKPFAATSELIRAS